MREDNRRVSIYLREFLMLSKFSFPAPFCSLVFHITFASGTIFSLIFLSLSFFPLNSPRLSTSGQARSGRTVLFFFSSARSIFFYFPFRQVAINLHFTRGRWDRFVKHYPRRGAAYGRVHERPLRRRLQNERYNTRGSTALWRQNYPPAVYVSRIMNIKSSSHAQPSSDRPSRIIRAERVRKRRVTSHRFAMTRAVRI